MVVDLTGVEFARVVVSSSDAAGLADEIHRAVVEARKAAAEEEDA